MRLTVRLMVAVLALGLSASAASAKWFPVHSVWSDNQPILIIDGNTGKQYQPSLGYSATSWQETTSQGFSHAVGLTSNGLYEFRMLSTSSNNNDEILGLWDVYHNGVLVCGSCVGKVYGLSFPIGNYFKIYVGTPLGYAERWHFSGYITNRFDY